LLAAPGHPRWLSPEERERAERYRAPGTGTLYRATRVLVRGVLASLLGCAPEALEFSEEPHGRPVLRPRGGTPPLDFNASRCRSWVALVVTGGARCGVDVEDVSRKVDFLGVARAFAPAERTLLLEATPEERRRLFFSLWTLKEATLKALGTGLTLSLGACSFHFPDSEAPRVTFGSAVAENAAEWSFAELPPDAGHALALAVRAREAPSVVLHRNAETCATVASIH
jgi:4'-phosphopantetheinyl transferase